MKKVRLGKTGIEVTALGFGTLPMGSLQADMDVERGARVIRRALSEGINFIDTAHLYGTYKHISEALKGFDRKVIIASKSAAATYEDMKSGIDGARRALARDQIDIFHLHAARVLNPFEERRRALDCLLDCKSKGIINAVGISTHVVSAVRKAAELEEIDVVHPLINKTGQGLMGGTVEDMLQAIQLAHQNGKGIYVMKALAGGNLLDDFDEALRFVMTNSSIDSVVVGMVAEEEVEMNVRFFSNQTIPAALREGTKKAKKIIIMESCRGCGTCVDACPSQAIEVINGKAVVDPTMCVLCGYCVAACPDFWIRVV